MAILRAIDPPTPFASTKDLQAFLDRWEGTPEAAELQILQVDLQETRDELARRQGKNVS